ncbi:MAG: DUF454 family protein [Pseudomonadales bacterium]
MIKRAAILTLAAIFCALGLIGLVIPILPGVLFLGVALLCAASVLPQLAHRLNRYPAWRDWHMRWRAGAQLPFAARLKLAFWLSAEAATRPFRTR